MNTKACKLCAEVKPLADFYPYKSGNPYAACKKCHIARTRKRLDENPERKAESAWKRRGINCTWKQYEWMVKEQDSKCAICEKPCGSGRRLAVDHNHDTGVVRGLLCLSCNQLIGKLENGTVPFHRLATYLEKELKQWLDLPLPMRTPP